MSRSFCYANTNTSGITNLTGAGSTEGVTALSTAQMMMATSFDSWNVGGAGSVWTINAGASYPYLPWQPLDNVPGP